MSNWLYCSMCNKMGHLPDRCWKSYPELQRKKNIQRIEGEGDEVERQMNGIQICACVLSSSSSLPDYSLTQDPCDDVPGMIEDPERTAWARVFRMDDPEEVPAAWSTIAAKPRVSQHVSMGASAQTTAAAKSDGNDPVASGNSGRGGAFGKAAGSEPRTCSRHLCQMKIVHEPVK